MTRNEAFITELTQNPIVNLGFSTTNPDLAQATLEGLAVTCPKLKGETDAQIVAFVLAPFKANLDNNTFELLVVGLQSGLLQGIKATDLNSPIPELLSKLKSVSFLGGPIPETMEFLKQYLGKTLVYKI